MATAQLAIRDRTLSARLVRMIGTLAPSTKPAVSAWARKLSCLARMFPASRSGATRMSGSPATSEWMSLVSAACLLIALNKDIHSDVAGDPDILVAPDLEAGNI